MIGRGLRARPVRARILNHYSGRKARERRFGEYHADAVHFDTDTRLALAAMSASDSDKYAFSGWFKIAAVTNSVLLIANNTDGFFGPYLLTGNSIEVYSQDEAAKFLDAYDSSPAYPLGAWFNLRGKVDTTAGTVQAWLGNTAVTFGSLDSEGGPFTVPFSGHSVNVHEIGHDAIDMADLWFKAGSSYSFAVGGDDFITADGKPKDPSGFPPADILLTGDASSFATNQGTGGGFAVTGALTNASTSPSD